MTSEKSDRRRKRSSSGGNDNNSPASSSSPKTKSTVTAIFAIVFILSIINIEDSSTNVVSQQRRYLAAVNSDEEDNVWARRQLRARNNRGRNKERKLIGDIDPNLSDAAVEDGLTNVQPSMTTKRMLAKPHDKYVSICYADFGVVLGVVIFSNLD